MHQRVIENAFIGDELALHYLDAFDLQIKEKSKTFMGYPCNSAFKLEKFFQWWEHSSLSKIPLNDVGSPDRQTHYQLNARPFEQAVLQFFAELYSLDPFWGYITTGGTLSNEQGLYIGRQVLSRVGNPLLYLSEEAHYSILSLGRLLGLECCLVESTPTGEIDYHDLERKLNPDRPALFSLSIGTTFKGAIDRVEVIAAMVKDKGIGHCFFHADAALFGGYLPFYPDLTKPELNFERYPYDSIAVSGHKFFGSPIPLGIFLIRNEYIQILKADYIEYLHTHNLTIPCSRSALNTLLFWWIISTTPTHEFAQQAKTNLDNAHYLCQQLQIRHYPAWLNPYSNTVYFKAPTLEFCKRWTLSLFTCRHLGPLAHVVVMQHVTKEMIHQFIKELDREIR